MFFFTSASPNKYGRKHPTTLNFQWKVRASDTEGGAGLTNGQTSLLPIRAPADTYSLVSMSNEDVLLLNFFQSLKLDGILYEESSGRFDDEQVLRSLAMKDPLAETPTRPLK